MKKILVYYDSMHPKGGVERVIANLFNEISKEYEVTLLTCDDVNSSYILSDKIRFISMNKNRFLDMKKSKFNRINTIIKSLYYNHKFLKKIVVDYDYIYVATPLTALEMYLLGKKYRKKTVVSEHASFFACNKIYQMIRKYVYPKMYLISVPTTLDTKYYLKNNCNALYVPHMATFPAKKKNVNKNNKIALSVGRLTHDKQHLLLLKLWNELKKQNRLDGWKLRIIGEGELYEVLLDFINKQNLASSVYLGGNTNSIAEEYKQADLFLFTSVMEGFGMVLLEAMAYGLPCISFNCPSGPQDIIKNDINGYLIENYNKEAYKLKILEIIRDKELMSRLSEEAYKTVLNWDNKKIIKIWNEKIFK